MSNDDISKEEMIGIKKGIADMEAGRVISLQDLEARLAATPQPAGEQPRFRDDADKSEYERLLARAKKSQETESPMMPIFLRDDGTINVQRMKELPMFGEFVTGISTEQPQRCETTGTMRYSNPLCKCPTYAGNLGPCDGFEEGGNGRCVYCDHTNNCHKELDAQRCKDVKPLGIQAAAEDQLEREPKLTESKVDPIYGGGYIDGWQQAIGSILGSLRGYPNAGGDINIMREVERIVRESTPTDAALDKELKKAQAALERDRTKVAECITAAKKALDGYEWLRDSRGPYAWDDDRWHAEFTNATNAIREAIEPMIKIAADWSNCPKTWDEVQAARAAQGEAMNEQPTEALGT
jgi:hypothetical protein